ncbi:MAG TPA: sulfotransferase family 2 domain-containing protein [Vicinamibacterales bacterium]|nr:sulfotransferase family 2 domain-containing protein [Vicinamibacterales bacterium]
MAVILRSGAVFLHVPKTGGSWVNAVLADQGLIRTYVKPKHVSACRFREYARHHPELYVYYCLKHGPRWHARTRGTFRFFFVRHPLAWYESIWKYMSGRRWRPFPERPSPFSSPWHPKSTLYRHASDDFNEFMTRVLDDQPGYVTNLYHYYDAIPADFVGHQEHLADDLIEVLKRLNEKFDEERIRRFPRINESGRVRPPSWAPEVRARAEALEYAALVKYGYVRERAGQSAPMTTRWCRHMADASAPALTA